MRKDIKPANWDSAAALIVNSLVDLTGSYEVSTTPDEVAVQSLVEIQFDNIVEMVFHSKYESDELEELFFDIAVEALHAYSLVKGISDKKAASLIYDTVVGKQKMYGHGNIARFEIPGIVIRMNDKLERLKNLRNFDGPVLFEPIEDTWLDICGYSIIAIMWLRDWFLLNLKNQDKDTKTSGEK
jgi:hypothetical protein